MLTPLTPNQHLGGCWVKIDLKVTKTIKSVTYLLGIVVFAGKKNRRRPPGAGTPYVFAGECHFPGKKTAGGRLGWEHHTWPGLANILAIILANILANIGWCFGIYRPSSQGLIPISRSAGMVFLYLDQVAHPYYSPGVPISQKCCQIWGPKINAKPRSGIFPEFVRDVPRVIFNPLGNYLGTQKYGLYLYVWGTPLAHYSPNMLQH